jgi:hypothetical protein
MRSLSNRVGAPSTYGYGCVKRRESSAGTTAPLRSIPGVRAAVHDSENLARSGPHLGIVGPMSEQPESAGIECRQIAELLTDYVEGRLPPATRELIDWHIDGCGPCVAFLNTFRSTVKAVRTLADPPPVPPELKQRLIAVLRSTQASRRP